MNARGRIPLQITAAALALGMVAAVFLVWLRPPAPGPGPAVPSGPGPQSIVESRPELAAPALREASQAPRAVQHGPRLACLSSADRTPVEGVRLYSVDGPITPPSDGEGGLEIPQDETGRIWTAWAPGWSPTRVSSRPPFPTEILLEPAAAGLSVRVRSTEPQARIARTRLVPLGRPGAQGQPWAPRLEIDGALTAVGRQLPPGEYDVYVWITREKGAARVLPRQRVELRPDNTLDLELDAGSVQDRDVDG